MFSKEVCDKLGYYVYRLVDPRNAETFYVGKGKNNRVFEHEMCSLKILESNISEEDEIDLKFKTIKEIKDAGLEVIHIIQRYGLTEQEAFLIESVLIDVYSIQKNLTNKIKGMNSIDPINASIIEKTLCAPEYIDSKDNPDYIIIKVRESWFASSDRRYEVTRACWKMNIDRARKYKYVLSVTNGIVKEVYRVIDWMESPDANGRIEFNGVVAEDSVRQIFIDKKIPEKYRVKGMASPCIYSSVK